MSSVLTIAEAAEDLKITESVVWGYHRKGLLDVMYTRNVGASSSRRGPRDARIDRGEWERFKKALTVKIDPPRPAGDSGSAQGVGDQGDGKPARGRPRKGLPVPAGADKWLKAYKAAK